MVSNIPPSYTTPPPYPSEEPKPPENGDKIAEQLWRFVEELREDMGPPPNTKALLKLLPKLEAFLKDNKQAIEKIAEKNGYPISGPFSITSMFSSAISAITVYLKDPNDASLDLLNESITQLHYYMITKAR